MKKHLRVFICVFSLVMLFSSLGMVCYAEGSPEAVYTKRECKEISGEALAVITGILKDSADIGVKQVEQHYQHAAVLMGDGTVRAFFSDDHGMIRDYGQCQVSSWKNIQTIAVSAGCTYALTDKGTLVWAGLPGLNPDYSEDAGWAKISSGNDYTDIACVGSTLFALRANGVADIAFAPPNPEHKEAKELCDEVEKLSGIIDMQSLGDHTLCVLTSSGEIKILRDTDEYYNRETNKSEDGVGAACLKLHEGAVCAVMNSGEYKRIDELDEAEIPKVEGKYCFGASHFNSEKDKTTRYWHAKTGFRYGYWLYRRENGDMGIVLTSNSLERGNTSYYGFGREREDWHDVEDAYVFIFALPESYIKDQTDSTGAFWMEVFFGVKKNGECLADYHLGMRENFTWRNW